LKNALGASSTPIVIDSGFSTSFSFVVPSNIRVALLEAYIDSTDQSIIVTVSGAVNLWLGNGIAGAQMRSNSCAVVSAGQTIACADTKGIWHNVKIYPIIAS
jgi:hypothetical protein